jgi:hypothetical protein
MMTGGMVTGRASSIIRRAVAVHLTAVAPVLAGCSSQTTPSTFAEPNGKAADGGVMATCVVTSTTPISSGAGSCSGWTYAFNGSYAECGGDTGLLSLPACEKLCPPPPDGGVPAGTPLSSCGIYTCGDGPAECSAGSALGCVYDDCGFGRRPAGLRRNRSNDDLSPLASFLSRMAHLEAASVHAFERLARELAAHRAPLRLQRAALRAARDEQRHTRVAASLAARAGAMVLPPRVVDKPVRSLEIVARENVVEGCVRETFGAAIALAQSSMATDPQVRAAMKRIGADELRHADLAWDVAQWLDSRLEAAARNRVARAGRRAARDLVRDASGPVRPELLSHLGLPEAWRARGIAKELTDRLWSARLRRRTPRPLA